MSDIWERLQFFNKNENWGDPHKMDEDLLLQMDRFRGKIEKPCVLTCPAYATSGHSNKSYHYKGRALDCRFLDPKTREPLTVKEHVLIALKAPFGGIGIYTWSELGPFLHFDNREMINERTIWVCEAEGKYEQLTDEFLRRTFL